MFIPENSTMTLGVGLIFSAILIGLGATLLALMGKSARASSRRSISKPD